MNSDLLFDMIDGIASVSGKKAKMNMMIPELQKVFVYAYDPFKTYGVRDASFRGTLNGMLFEEKVWKLLDHLVARTLTGGPAKNLVNKVSMVLSFKSAELFVRILNKDLKCGVSIKAINKVYGDILQEGITMQPKEYESRLAVFPTFASLKLRGCRGYYRWSDQTIYSRSGKPYRGLSHITNALFPFGHDYDGELLVPNIPFEDGSGIVKSHKETPEVHFCIFDAPATTIPYRERRGAYLGLKSVTPEFIVVCNDMYISDERNLFGARDYAFKDGYEGLVMKDPNSLYSPGYTSEWLKLKEEAEPIDLEVFDVFEGIGKYSGALGGVVVHYNGVPVRVGGGFSDSQRKYYYAHPNQIVGHTILVKYQEKTKHGSLRNPIFVEVRDDK